MKPLFPRRCHMGFVIVCFFLLDSPPPLAPAKFDEVKIGGMFDNYTAQAQKAFLQEVHDFNLELSLKHRYALRNDTSVLDVTDSFAVSNALCKHLSDGNLAIFGVSNASSMATIQSYTNTFQVPFVTFSMAYNTSSTSSFQIYMRPMYVHALVKLVLEYGWAHMYYIYNSDEGLIRLQQMFQAVALNTQDKFLSIDAKRVTSEDDAFSLIRHLHKQDERKLRRFVLDMPVDQVERILLRVIGASDLNNAKFHFLLGDLNMLEMNLTSFTVGGLNVTGFSLLQVEDANVESLLKRWPYGDNLQWPGGGSNSLKYEAALAVDAVKLFTKAFTSSMKKDSKFLQRAFSSSSNTLIKCTDDSHVRSGAGVSILQEMKKTTFESVTGHVAFDETGHRKDFKLELSDINMNRPTARVAQWDDKTKKLNFYVKPKMIPTPGAKIGITSVNKTQRVTTIISEPYVMYKTKPSEDGSPPLAKEHLEGFCVDLAYAVADKCHFDWVMHEVKDKTYGQPQDNGTWNGMVGELIRHEADMAIAPLTITADRERVVDFTKPFMSLGISIMIKKPLNHKAHVFSFMDPLSYEIWMCIVFAYIGVSVVLFLVSRFSPNEWHLTVGEHQVTNDFSISNSLWFSLGAFMQQGCDISPRSMSGRIVGSVWWFFTLIIISSYTANLAAFLTVERMLTPIDSAEDLAKQTDIQYGTVQSGSTASFFMNSKVQIYQRMWAYMTSATPSVFVKRIEEGIQRVRTSNGKYAFLLESTTNDYYNQRKPCDTMMVGQNLNSNGFGIATPIGSEMKDHLNFAVLELREKGFLAKWETVWWLKKGECESKKNSSKEGAQSALTLQNVAGIFYILIGGLATALFSAAIEFFYKSKMDSTKYKTSFRSALRSSARLSFRGHLDSAASERYMNGSYKRAVNADRGTLYTYAPPSQVSVDTYENANAHQTEV